MKKKDVPQDESLLKGITREIYYAKDKEGNYDTSLSTGWDIKSAALDGAWEEVERRKATALAAFKAKEASPILYFMEKNLMDIPTLAAYTGYWSFFVKRHLKYGPFQKLKDKQLERYAKAFRISKTELKNFDGNDGAEL